MRCFYSVRSKKMADGEEPKAEPAAAEPSSAKKIDRNNHLMKSVLSIQQDRGAHGGSKRSELSEVQRPVPAAAAAGRGTPEEEQIKARQQARAAKLKKEEAAMAKREAKQVRPPPAFFSALRYRRRLPFALRLRSLCPGREPGAAQERGQRGEARGRR